MSGISKQPVPLVWIKGDTLMAGAEPVWDCSGAGEHWERGTAVKAAAQHLCGDLRTMLCSKLPRVSSSRTLAGYF